jgi:putative glutamine amidotransferase
MEPRVGITYSIPSRAKPYAEALRGVGLEPVLISPGDARTLDGLAGLLLSGGCDIDPALYSARRQADTSDSDPDRDALDKSLLEQAIAADLPILAICRGMQMLNVVHGGTLRQDVPEHCVKNHTEVHSITIRLGSRLERIMGEGEFWVNSRHHQAVDRIGGRLVVAATAHDGTVEALEDPVQRFVVAVQWHPEDRLGTHAYDRALFQAFAEAVAR